MRTVAELLADGLHGTPLTILLFGPSLGTGTSDPHASALRDKRAEIRDALRADGHKVVIVEDEIDATAPAPLNNPMIQEMAILQSYDGYDLVVALVYTPGTNLELGIITSTKEIASKSHLFICKAFSTGAAYQACQMAETVRKAEFTPYDYPADLVDCHVLTKVQTKVRSLQVAKFIL